MSISLAEKTLRQFARQSLNIQGIVLVSAQGQPLTASIGLDENVTLIMAGTLLQVGNQIAQECEWSDMEQVSLQAREGYLTMLPCGEDTFIMIKTSDLPNHSLQQELKQIIRIISAQLDEKIALNTEEAFVSIPQFPSVYPKYSHPVSRIHLNLPEDFLGYFKQELTEFIGPIAPFVCKRILRKNPDFSLNQLVEALVKTIPNREQAKEFYQRILGKQFT
jgi:predicted regulator of Ras-like GTPase activity (Roadblock/LC7/MglB family)